MQTLATHTRLMIRDAYRNSEFINEYQIRIDNTFSNDPISVLVKEIRNYILHYSLPVTFSKLIFSQDLQTKEQKTISKVLLEKRSLLDGYKWEPAAKNI